MAAVLQEFISILVSGIVTFARGVANGVSMFAIRLFLDWEVQDGPIIIHGLSTFGGIIAIFAGLALAVSITTRVYTWVTSLGN